MKKYNPTSKTSFVRTKSYAVKHYSLDNYECKSCGSLYHPKVYTHPYAHQLFTFFLSVSLMAALFLKATFAFFAAAITSVFYFIYYRKKERKIWERKGRKMLKIGEVILECPKCGCLDASISN